MIKKTGILLFAIGMLFSCKKQKIIVVKEVTPFFWESANLYFMLTDRFNNGDRSNDVNYERTDKTAVLRGFEGGDLKGVTQKIEEGYFTDLGINAIWMSPIVEQIHSATDESTGVTYGFHGYWTKDWTSLDKNFGTPEELKELVATAHKNGIRIVLDAVINHTGPATEIDGVWSSDWVRTSPKCTYDTYKNTIMCTLVKNLPDIKTESDAPVELPIQLVEKWKSEGRYNQEVKELDAFFARTGYPRAPRFYIVKWLTDYITEYGIDGYRVDTVKHTEEYVWQEFRTQCDIAFAEYKKNNPTKVLDNNPFYLVGEIYNYNLSSGKFYDFGDKNVNYFDRSFHSLINFEFKWNAQQLSYEDAFVKNDSILQGALKGYGTLNYLTSHDDGQPFDAKREKPFETATRLLLAPGTSQVYYGDETARTLIVEGTQGDATLRSFMNWNDLKNNSATQKVLAHWQKLGKFRANHPSVGAGKHQMISENPYVFKRTFQKDAYKDAVVVGLNLSIGKKEMKLSDAFKEGAILKDAYSKQTVVVKNGLVQIDSPFDIVLLEEGK